MNASLIIQSIPAVITILGFLIVLGMYLTKVNRNEKDISKLDDRYYTLNNDIVQKINAIVQKINAIFDKIRQDPYTARNSPIELTEKGQKISEELYVKDTINKNFQYFKDLVIGNNNNNTLNPYDIQQKSIAVIREHLLNKMDENEKHRLKTFAYKEGVEIESFFTMYGVVLRNLIFNEKDIKVEEVDLHDPNNN